MALQYMTYIVEVQETSDYKLQSVVSPLVVRVIIYVHMYVRTYTWNSVQFTGIYVHDVIMCVLTYSHQIYLTQAKHECLCYKVTYVD